MCSQKGDQAPVCGQGHQTYNNFYHHDYNYNNYNINNNNNLHNKKYNNVNN